jgi:formate hydrogenlyase subunit 6/NADH:ubiquinone oxidoreductase subunit I
MKVCPTNVLQPAVFQAGTEGVFTPRMDFQSGQCEWSCNECGKVCPTGAIEPLTLPVKRRTVIGRAYIDENRCIPYADGLTCLVCQELCPVAPKAIEIDAVAITTPGGAKAMLGRPKVVAERCIGCGVCEHVCPVPHESAIAVYAVGDERRGG